MKIDPLLGGASFAGRSSKDAIYTKENNDFQAVLQKVQSEKDDKKLREACQELEAVFVNQLLRQMRATVPRGGILEESTGSQIYREMLDEEYSKLIAKSPGNLGIGEMLYKQLKRDIATQELQTSQTDQEGGSR